MKLLVLLLSVLCWRLSQSQITFTQPPRDIVVAIGNQARFDCTFTSSAPTSTIWQKDSDVLSPSDPRYTYLMNNSLLIDPTVSGDDGTYMCVVTNQNTLESSMQSASLTFAFFLGSFLTSPESQTVEQGAVVFFFCIHSGSLPPANITWRLNGDFIMASSRISIQTSLLEHTNGQVSSSLAIISVQRMDMGILTCTATNSFLPNSSVTSREGTLTVTAQPYPPSITRQPDDVVVQDGQDTVFVCSADGEPVPQIMWTFNNIPLTSASPQVTITSSGGVSTAAILSVGSGNVGSYQCMASNSQGDVASNVVQLSLASLGTSFLLEPPDTTAIIGQNATIDCAPPLSVPPADITWSRDLVLLSDPRSSVLENGSLLISDVDFSDQAMYYCTATNPTLGTSRTSRGAVLTTIGIPTITPAIITIPAGQSASFLCSAIGNPSPQITWYRGTNQITDDNPRVTLTDSTLTISTVSIDDRDYYTCRAVFPSGTTETNAFLNILIPPSFINSTLNVTAIPSSSSITLPCSTFTDPTITFTWFFEGDLLFPSTSDGPLVLLSNGGLVISSPQISDEGVYTCMAVNNLGTVNGTVYLDVLIAPTVSAESASVVAIRGDTVTLRCTSNGEPIPMQSWSRNGSDLSGSRYMISDDGMELSISDIMEGDMGVYTCHASNIVGSNSTTVMLSVNSPPSAVATPTSLTINAGLTANFLCAATGNPVPDIVWLTGSFVDVITLGNPRIEVQPTIGGGTSLVINDVQGSDQQQYICEASNIISIDTSVVSLTVLIVPRVNISTETVAVQGNPFTLDCNPIGQPVPTVTWFRDGIEIEEDDRLAVDNNGRLTFTSILSTDAATYRCEAQNTAGMDSADTSLLVLVVPIITVTTSTVTTIQGFSAVLDCLATGDPPPTVTWFFNSAFLPNIGTPRIQQSLNNSLLISEVQTTDRGTYICQASNTAGTQSASIVLIVYVVPVIRALESSVTVVIGNSVTMTCIATGDPIPIQTWTRNGMAITGTRFEISDSGSTLAVTNVREEDEGLYTCHASNPASTQTDTVNLNVIVPPSFTILNNSTVIVNTPHTITCAASGDPTPSITWRFEGSVIPSTQGVLSFSPVSRGSDGFYTCTASNEAGTISDQVYLDVQYIPEVVTPPTNISIPINLPAQFTCVANGNPPPSITWLLNNVSIPGAVLSTYTIAMVTASDAGTYGCVATNSIGSVHVAASLSVIFPPSPPNLLSATAISSSVIFVQWNRSANDGGSPVTGYVIEYRDTAESASTFESRLVELDVSANLDGLAPFVNYEVRVRGHNIAGPSDPSNTQTTQTHPLAPSVPINFGVLSFTPPSSLVVVWSLPDPLNGMFGAYELRYGPEDTFDDNLIERLLFTTRFTINGIQVGVVYIIQVRASTISLTGETLWGPFAILRVRDGVELEIPTTMSTSPPSTDAPSTDAPSTDAPSTDAPSTDAPSTDAPSTDAPTTDAPSTDTPSSTAGITTESPTVSLNPPKSVPASVVALIPPETTGQILVYWMVPSPPSDDFIGYSITISPPPPPAVTTPILVPVTPISGTHVIMGLDHFTLYTVTVATYNNDGVGPQNMSSTIQTPQAAPTPPRDVQVTIINTFSILVSWSQPDPTNGVLTEYLIRVLTVTTGEEFTRKTITLPGQNVITISGLDLDNVRYSVLVSASTEAGRGPESEPIFVDDIITTTQLPSSTPTITPSPSTITRDDITTQLDITPSPQTNTTTEPRDHVYYIIRIVPPVVGPLLLVLVLVVVSLCCCTQVCIVGKRKKGLYQFSELESDYQMHLKQIPEDKEEVVPNESVKGALDSNFTFNPQSQESSEEEGNDFPDEPDIGEHISSDQVILLPYGDAMGRDALQEQEDQSHDDFMTENHTYNSDSLENQSNDGSIRYGQHKVTYQPGDYSPEELDTIRAKKAQERERRLGRQGQVQTTPPNKGRRRMQRHFNPSSGMSSGGIMETRIGEVGMSRDGKLPTVPESAAHMY